MVTFAEIRAQYLDWGCAYPSDWPKPQNLELEQIQFEYQIVFPQDFIQFQIVECHTTPMGDFAFDNFGWAEPSLGPMESLRAIVEDAQFAGVPHDLAPFRHDNGDYYCCTGSGDVVLWDHQTQKIEADKRYQWASFSAWVLHSLSVDV